MKFLTPMSSSFIRSPSSKPPILLANSCILRFKKIIRCRGKFHARCFFHQGEAADWTSSGAAASESWTASPIGYLTALIMNQRVCKVTRLSDREMLSLIFKPFASHCERRHGRSARVVKPCDAAPPASPAAHCFKGYRLHCAFLFTRNQCD